MSFFRLLWRGIRDVYEQFTWYVLLSIAFCVLAAPLILGYGYIRISVLFLPVALLSGIFVPPALITLFHFTDPRLIINRPELKDVVSYFRRNFVRGWKIGGVTIPVLIALAWNIAYFAGSGEWLALLVPLWVVMWVFLLPLTAYMFSLAGTLDSNLQNAFRGGMFVLVKHPFRSIGLTFFLLITGWFMILAILPMVVIGPPLYASIINRMVFEPLEIEVIDPNKPTNERQWEREQGINQEPRIWDRIRGKRT